MKEKKKFRYQEVYEDIFSGIIQGKFPIHTFLPSEKTLCRLYAVERTTVRKALDLLVKDGVVRKVQGIGSKVIGTTIVKTAKNCEENLSDSILFLLATTPERNDRITQPFYSSLFFNIEKTLRKVGYKTIYSRLSANDDMESIFHQDNYAGVMFSSYGITNQQITYLKNENIPFVCINSEQSHAINISSDHFLGAYKIGKYICQLHHKKIARIKGRENEASCFYRTAGLNMAFYEEGLDLSTIKDIESNWTAEDAYIKTKQFLLDNQNDLPSVIIAYNDDMAFGCMKAIHERGLKIPEDVSLCGYDNVEQSKFCIPPLTTFHNDIISISDTAIHFLLSQINGEKFSDIKIKISGKLIKRDSLAPYDEHQLK